MSNIDNDMNSLSNEELVSITDKLGEQPKSGFDKFAQGAGDLAVSASTGVRTGAKEILRDTFFFTRALTDTAGITDRKETEKFLGSANQAREADRQMLRRQAFPTAAKVASVGTEIIGKTVGVGKLAAPIKAAQGAGALAQVGGQVAQGAASGALIGGLEAAGDGIEGKDITKHAARTAAIGGAVGLIPGALAARKARKAITEGKKGFTTAQRIGKDTRAASVQQLEKQAKNIMPKGVEEVDIASVVAKSRSKVLGAAKKLEGEAFKKVDKAAGAHKFKMENFQAEVKKVLESDAMPTDMSPGLKKIITRVADAKDLSLKQIRVLKKFVGNEVGGLKSPMSTASNNDVVPAAKIHALIKGAEKRAAGQIGLGDDLAAAQGMTKARFSKMLNNKKLTQALDDGNVDDLFDVLATPSNKDSVRKLFSVLDKTGRDNLQAGILKHVATKATSNGILDGAKVAKEMEKIAGVRKAFFTPVMQKQIDGLINLSELVKRAPGASRTIQPGKFAVAAQWLSSTAAGQKILTRAANVKDPNSAAAVKIFQTINNAVNTTLEKSGTARELHQAIDPSLKMAPLTDNEISNLSDEDLINLTDRLGQ